MFTSPELTMQELMHLQDALPRVIYAKASLKVKLHLVKPKKYRKFKAQSETEVEEMTVNRKRPRVTKQCCLLCGLDADLCCNGAPYRHWRVQSTD